MDVIGGHGVEVADAAADVALEYKDVPLAFKVLVAAHVCISYLIPFFFTYVYWCAIDLCANRESAERVVEGDILIKAPIVECTEHFEQAVDVVVASLCRVAALRDQYIQIRVLCNGDTFPVLICSKKFVFVPEKVPEIAEVSCCKFIYVQSFFSE